MNKRDLKADWEQLKRTMEIFEHQQVTFDTPEDEIVPEIDIEAQRMYTLMGLGEQLAERGVEWLERAIKAEDEVEHWRELEEDSVRHVLRLREQLETSKALTREFANEFEVALTIIENSTGATADNHSQMREWYGLLTKAQEVLGK